jgi:hypothetical protein
MPAARLAFAVVLAALAGGCARAATPYPMLLVVESTPPKASARQVTASGGQSVAVVQSNVR